jgi:spore maturation protein CgeB
MNRTQHSSGNALLGEAAERAPIEFWGYSVDGWPPEATLRKAYRGEAWGLEMYRLLRSARVSLNRHIEVAEGYANNMRLFEATGVGTMLLTDMRRNLADLFEPGVEVATYEGLDDLVAKIEYYLEHENERAAIAAAGQRRTLAEHTWAQRMTELADALDEELARRRDAARIRLS